MEDQARQVLLGAAELLERDGWCQGMYHNTDGARCAIGALSAAYSGVGGDISAYRDARTLLVNAIGGRSIAPWNDDPTRTREEVVAKLREAAA